MSATICLPESAFGTMYATCSLGGPIVAGYDLDNMRRDIPEEFWTDFDLIRTALRAQIEILRTSIEALAADVAHMLDKDLGLTLPKLKDKVVQNYVFNFRKGGWARA